MLKQLKKVLHRQYSDTLSPNSLPVTVKNEMDVTFNVNNQEEARVKFYGCCSNRKPRFSGRQANERWGHNKNSTCSTDEKNLNLLGPESNYTNCFMYRCKFH